MLTRRNNALSSLQGVGHMVIIILVIPDISTYLFVLYMSWRGCHALAVEGRKLKSLRNTSRGSAPPIHIHHS